MSQEYEYEAGRSRARQSRRRPSMGNMENGRPAESAVQGRLAAEEGTGAGFRSPRESSLDRASAGFRVTSRPGQAVSDRQAAFSSGTASGRQTAGQRPAGTPVSSPRQGTSAGAATGYRQTGGMGGAGARPVQAGASAAGGTSRQPVSPSAPRYAAGTRGMGTAARSTASAAPGTGTAARPTASVAPGAGVTARSAAAAGGAGIAARQTAAGMSGTSVRPSAAGMSGVMAGPSGAGMSGTTARPSASAAAGMGASSRQPVSPSASPLSGRATPPDAGRRRAGISRGAAADEEGLQLWNELASRAEGGTGAGKTGIGKGGTGAGKTGAGTGKGGYGAGTGGSGNGNGSGGTGGGNGNGDGGDGGNSGGRRFGGSRKTALTPEAKRRKRIIKFIVAECFALAFIFCYAFVARTWSLVQRDEGFSVAEVKNEELATETLEKMEGYWTVAVFGVDSRGSNTGKGANADVNMLFNINRDTGEIRIVSVFRDSYLNTDDKGSYNKINQAYFVGGPNQAVKALNKNLDLDIQEYVTFNWKAVADAINILGGIDMEISKAEFSYINSFITETQKVTGIPTTQLKSAGMNHLDGVQAVAYGRLRLMDTDFARTERQRKVIQAAFDKAKKADFSVLNNIIVTVAPLVSTNIDTMDLVRMAQDISKYHIGETGGFPFARGDANMGRKGACVVPTTLESNVKELHRFLFDDENYTPTEQVKQISAKIISDTGLSKEGQFVYHADTDGGAVYKPKTTAAETTEKETKEPETDENGNPIETTEPETDEDGNVIETKEPETDEDGNPVETKQPQTDEFGMILPTENGDEDDGHGPGAESSGARPGQTGESQTAPTRPSQSAGSPTRPSRPGQTTESSSAASTSGANSGNRPTASTEETERAPIVNSPTRPQEPSIDWDGPGGTIQGGGNPSTGDGVILPPSTTAAEPTSPQEPIAPLA